MTNQQEAMLIIKKGISSKEPLFLAPKDQVLGNSNSSEILIVNPFVSRQHCRVKFDGSNFLISDLKSKNGTYLNGTVLEPFEEYTLKNGDIIELALDTVVMQFQSFSEDTLAQTDTITTEVSSLRVDQSTHEVWVRGKQVTPPLSPKEFAVLALLSSRQREIVRKDDIAKAGWPEREGDVGNQEIEQCIRRIRRKIEIDPSNPKLILTRRGVGYQLT